MGIIVFDEKWNGEITPENQVEVLAELGHRLKGKSFLIGPVINGLAEDNQSFEMDESQSRSSHSTAAQRSLVGVSKQFGNLTNIMFLLVFIRVIWFQLHVCRCLSTSTGMSS